MKEVLKHLFKYWKAVLCIILFLALQAICDLTLPDYTSRIINVGIQQSGIEDNTPIAISKRTYDNILLFTNDSKIIKDSYKLLDKDKLNKKEYENCIKKYPKLNDENIYILKNISEQERTKLNKVLSKPIFINYMLTSSNKESVNLQEEMKKNLPENMKNMEVIDIIKSISNDKKEKFIKNLNEKLKQMPDTIMTQTSISAVKEEYTYLKMDTAKMQTNYIFVSGIKMLGIALFSMACAITIGFIGARTAAKFARDLRNNIFNKVLDFSTTEFKNFGVSSLITRTTNDIQQVQMVMLFTLRMIFYAPIIGIGGVIKVMNTNASMSWIIAFAVTVILSIMLFMFFIVMPKFKIVQKLIDRLNLVTREILNGIPVVRAFSNQKYEEKRFDKANKDIRKTSLFVDTIMSMLMPTMMFVMNLVCILIVWKASHAINDGLMQVGDMLAFIQYTMQIVMAFLMVSMFSIMIPRSGVAAQRISEVLKTEPVIKNPKSSKSYSKRIAGTIEFKNVSFRYPDSDEDLLTDISFIVNKGETVAFIGSTGSGKSTLVNLIPRLFDVTKGEILVDGINIKDVDVDELHKKIGFVPQKGILFSGTIASNIKYGNKNASDEDMKKAAFIAQATEFIETKKDKYNSPISQGGTNVSGGQKQRLSIARAIATNPEIFIFDDSFSALDFKTDAKLRKTLRKETEGATILIVAQRVSTIMNADQIIVLDEGKIVGKGKHEELLENCEIYKEIATSQLDKEEL